MSDIGDTFDALKLLHQQEGIARRTFAAYEFPTARDLATAHSMTLLQHSEAHYQLTHPDGWLLNIYPGNRRLYSDRQRRGPYIHMEHDWGLLDVVAAAAKAAQRKGATL